MIFAWLLFFMSFLNIEIKAKCANTQAIRDYLEAQKARFVGVDEQTDTYFNTINGRLKLREGNIETNLIFYERANLPAPKSSQFQLVKVDDPKGLKEALKNSLGVKVIVKKRREIYYIENVKFHIDEITGLGNFIEIEAGNILADKSKEELLSQCEYYLNEFGIKEIDLIAGSYSDMLTDLKDNLAFR